MKTDGGFSILGLTVIVSTVLIALAVSIPWRNTVRRKEYRETAQNKMHTIEEALLTYYADNNTFPAQISDLVPGGYLDDDFGDSDYLYDNWKEQFRYEYPSGASCFLWSKGSNKADDTTSPYDTPGGDDIPVNPGTTEISAASLDQENIAEAIEELEVVKDAALAWGKYQGGTNWPANMSNLKPWYMWDSSYFMDPWGNDYILHNAGGWNPPDYDCIYSIGPNGIDDSGPPVKLLGSGDDIVISSST